MTCRNSNYMQNLKALFITRLCVVEDMETPYKLAYHIHPNQFVWFGSFLTHPEHIHMASGIHTRPPESKQIRSKVWSAMEHSLDIHSRIGGFLDVSCR